MEEERECLKNKYGGKGRRFVGSNTLFTWHGSPGHFTNNVCRILRAGNCS
jgi:hypothetical protein